ncbi:MAG TPA: hypothetical protein VNI20_12215 [Fimbriimonadaceae bacterium]|nr:hypothetical protein [Fimbriimonadaceae bacterium]
MLTALILSAVVQQQDSIELYRQWKPNTKLTYEVKTRLQVESRNYNTSIFIPESTRNQYQYTMDVGDVTSEGFAKVDYKRPEVTVTDGETAEHPPITKVEKLDEHYVMSMSPINAITDLQDLTPKKKDEDKDKDKKGGGGGGGLYVVGGPAPAQLAMGGFIQSLYQLAIFIGNADTSIDFGPRLPLLEVEPGDTWKVTASYQPQKLEGKKGKMVPQRLDYLYTYVGLVDNSDGQKVRRVTADLDLNTDIAPWYNDMVEETPRESHLRGLKLKLKAHIDFDLDPKTNNTLAARATSQGSLIVEITDIPNVPYEEQNIRGRTTLKLVSMK